MELGVSEKIRPILEKVKTFIEQDVMPVEKEYYDEINVGDRWQWTDRQTEILGALKVKAREQGLWNFFLTEGDSG